MSHILKFCFWSIRFVVAVCVLSCSGCAKAENPTQADVEKSLKAIWEKQPTGTTPLTTVQINSVKFGKTDKANEQEVVDGVPQGAMVTAALIDFTVSEHDLKFTNSTRRVREARVYKDKFGEWAVMTGQPHGQDITTQAPSK